MLRMGAFFDTYYIMCNRPVCGTFRRLWVGGDSSRSRGVRTSILFCSDNLNDHDYNILFAVDGLMLICKG
ncbi:MAG: hypothetical protein FWE83_06680 [Oscillospiraceae bacterium]|nr:hypothetical protein [Oscillospiraceae bacterium]